MLKILKYCLFLLIFLAFLIGVFLFCVNNNKVWEGILIKQLNSRLSGAAAKNVKIVGVRFIWPADLEFKGVQTELLVKKAVYIVKSDLSINTDLSQKKILFKISNASVKADTMNINDISSNWTIFIDPVSAEGTIGAPTMVINGNKFSSLNAEMLYDKNVLTISTMAVRGYNGIISGEGKIHGKQDYNLKLAFEQLEIEQLKKANAYAFSFFKGKVEGELNIQGRGKTISYIEGKLALMPGGYVKASLFDQYVEMAQLNRMLLPDKYKDAVIKDSFLPVEYETFEFNSVSDERITGIHNVWSKPYFIKIVDSPLHINLDNNLTEYVTSFLNQSKLKEML